MQHINLAHQLDRQVEPPFSARQQILALGGIAVLMVLVYTVATISSASVNSSLESAQLENQQVTAELNMKKAEKLRQQQNPQLDNEIAVLERGILFRREMLAGIDPEQDGKVSDFAEHLSGLSRQHIKGLWFTKIQLQQSGKQIVLLGQTRQPEFVPRFLQKLAAEPVFAGQQFKVLRMNIPENWQGALNFEVRSVEVGAMP